MNFLNDIHSQMKNMSVQDLENFCIQTISDCISAHSEIQELHNLTSATKKAQRSLKSKCKMLEAQCQRFERILDSVDNDEDDEVKIYAEPMKIKRSVGLQVDIRRNIDNFKLNNDEEQAPDKQIVETMSSDTAVPEKQVMQTMSSHTINEHSTLEPVNSNSIVKSVTQPPSHLSETLLPIKQCDINNNNTLKELVKEEKTSKYLSTASVQKIGELEGIPPVPFLKITQDVESIALAWNLNLSPSIAKIAYYELFVYHEKDPKIKDWKKIGHFRALPLPMGCTLSQIGKGNKYYFAVRAVDIHSRKGPFSRPVSTSQ